MFQIANDLQGYMRGEEEVEMGCGLPEKSCPSSSSLSSG
jgi:hypothetical protein